MSKKQRVLCKQYAEKRRQEKANRITNEQPIYNTTKKKMEGINEITFNMGYKENIVNDINMHKRMHGSACSNER